MSVLDLMTYPQVTFPSELLDLPQNAAEATFQS